jgi:DNA-binding response OmpR family regulator
VYQAVGPASVRVVLVLEVPTHTPGLPQRAAELADEFGTMMTRLLPGVRAERASVDAAASGSATATSVLGTPRDGLHVDAFHRSVTIDGNPVRLTYREFELLRYLGVRAGRPVSRAELMRNVWARDMDPRVADAISQRTVDTHIQRLRAKLGDHGRLLVTVRGRGYRLDAAG